MVHVFILSIVYVTALSLHCTLFLYAFPPLLTIPFSLSSLFLQIHTSSAHSGLRLPTLYTAPHPAMYMYRSSRILSEPIIHLVAHFIPLLILFSFSSSLFHFVLPSITTQLVFPFPLDTSTPFCILFLSFFILSLHMAFHPFAVLLSFLNILCTSILCSHLLRCQM